MVCNTTVFIPAVKDTITFYIGKNAIGNFEIIDLAKDSDMWFHDAMKPSCHVIAILPIKINKNELKYIIKVGSMLCKENTSIIYTYVKNIIGCVNVSNMKII